MMKIRPIKYVDIFVVNKVIDWVIVRVVPTVKARVSVREVGSMIKRVSKMVIVTMQIEW